MATLKTPELMQKLKNASRRFRQGRIDFAKLKELAIRYFQEDQERNR